MRFLFVDRITNMSVGQSISGLKHITYDDYFLSYDEQGRCCFVSALIGEALGQLAAWNVMAARDFLFRPVAGITSSARLYRPAVYVGETLMLESTIDSLDNTVVQYHGEAKVHGEVVFALNGALGPLLPMEQFIDRQEVLRQFNEINRPQADFSFKEEESFESFSPEEKRIVPWFKFDKILLSKPGVEMVAEKRITRAAPYFPDHFPNKPVLPLTVLLECKINLAREFVKRAQFAQNYQISELKRIKMKEFILPGDVVVTYLSLKSQDAQSLVLSFRSEVNGKRVCVLDIILLEQSSFVGTP